jgi:excisionase family DNA binding protein
MEKSPLKLAPLDTAQRYTINEALAYLRTSRATIYNLIAAGEIRVLREGKRTYVPGSEIARRSMLPQA